MATKSSRLRTFAELFEVKGGIFQGLHFVSDSDIWTKIIKIKLTENNSHLSIHNLVQTPDLPKCILQSTFSK
jgi:hypothetical protein